ncbi:MAG: amidohydrolase family protein, partial [Cetobacterium sp.]
NLGCDCYPYKAFSTLIGSAVFDNNYIENHDFNYEQLQVASGPLKGSRCTKGIFEDLRKTAPETLVVGHMMIEKDIDTAILNKNTVIVSDGILTEIGEGHPRAAGTFPKFLKEYVKEKKLLSIEEAIEKITFSPAKILGINKGSLEIGADADITIFSLDEIEDQATFENTMLPPNGIKYVIINGRLSLIDNEIVNSNSGKSIRKFL